MTSAAVDSEEQKRQRVTDRNGKQENTCVTRAGSGEGPEDGLELRLPGQTQRTSEQEHAGTQASSPLFGSSSPHHPLVVLTALAGWAHKWTLQFKVRPPPRAPLYLSFILFPNSPTLPPGCAYSIWSRDPSVRPVKLCSPISRVCAISASKTNQGSRRIPMKATCGYSQVCTQISTSPLTAQISNWLPSC